MNEPIALRRLAATSAATGLILAALVCVPAPASADSPGPVEYEAPPSAAGTLAPAADPFGGIPCIGASDAVYSNLGCSGQVTARYDLPADLAPSIVSSSRAYNCDPGPTTPSTEVITVTNSASVGVTTGVANGTNGQTWIANGGTVGGSAGFSLFGLVSIGAEGGYTHTQTEVTGWTYEESQALTKTYSSQESYTLRVPAYSWGFMAFRPHYTQTEVEWTWKDPTKGGKLSHATQAVRFPKTEFKDGATVASGDWERHIVPMTPAEINACEIKGRPAYPTFEQPTVATLEAGHTLDTVPFLYTTSRQDFPVQRVSTSIKRPTGLPQTTPLATAASRGKTTAVETVAHALLMPGPSEAGFWLGGSCTAFTARVGYGYDSIWDESEFTRDTLEVWSAKLIRGALQMSERLSSTLVPAKPGWADADASALQASIDVKLPAGADVLVLRTVTGGGFVRLDEHMPRVVVAEPRIECGSGVDDSTGFQRSVYADPIVPVTVDLAGTPAEAAVTAPVDGKLFAQPTRVDYGWKPSADAPNSGCPNQPEAARTSASALPQTTVDFSCGMQPLRVAGTTYDSGVGFHSNGSVTWESTPPTCTRVEMGVGFDDSVSYEWRAEHTATLEVDGVAVQNRTLRRDGSSGVQWFSVPLDLGPHTITLRATSSGENFEGHVDIVNPVLTCQYQGPRTEAPEVPHYTPTGLAPRSVSGMTFVEAVNGWGPVERDSSLGEDAAGDGRPMSIGGRSGWSDGLGVAPGGDGAVSRVTVAVPASCKVISSWVGIDDEVGDRGSAEFQVWVDGKSAPVANSGVMTGSDGARFLWADVTGAKTVTLLVTDGADGNAYDHADWAEPTLYC